MTSSTSANADQARRLWTLFEPVHAVTYFSPASHEALTDAGFKGFWMGYFAARSAPLGDAATAPVVRSAFFNFAPRLVDRALPDAWSLSSVDAALEARVVAAAATLRQTVPDLDEHVRRSLPLLESAAAAARCDGRVLGAANQQLPLRDDPVERLWQAATTLREHRGDGHVAALVAAGLDGVESLVLATKVAPTTVDPHRFREVRGWTADEWHDATERLTERHLLDEEGRPTGEAALLHSRLEHVTDEIAWQPFATGLTDSGRDLLATVLRPIAAGARTVLPFPNPIGLPAA